LSNLQYLYSFDMIVGQIISPTGFPSLKVDSIKTMTIAAFPRKVFYLTQTCSYSPVKITLVENIGPLEAFIFWTDYYLCYTLNQVNDFEYYYLNCFKDTQGSYPDNCTPITAIKTSPDLSFSIFPNPADNQIEIDMNQLKVDKLEILDLAGVSHYSEFLISGSKYFVNLSQFKEGIYFLKLYSNNQQVGVKKLLITH
jgi:hypothetical protein